MGVTVPAPAPEVAPVRGKKKRSYAVFQVGFAFLLLAAGWLSFGRNVLSPLRPRGAPEQLGEMRVGSFTDGPEALAQVDRLHGTGISLLSACIVEYSHAFNPYHGTNSERVTVWVGKAGSAEAAEDLIWQMREGITKGGSPFSDLRTVEAAGDAEVFQVQGPGGQHFFYASRKNGLEVVWLTISNSSDPLSLLNEALESF